ncbi:MAG: YciI family protein [Rhizobiaceae bacterium]
MQYVCLVYHDDAIWDALTDAERKEIDRDSGVYDRELEAQGHMVLAHALRSEKESKIVRRRSRKKLVTDGPFTESKEQLVGFIVVEAKDLDQAVEMGSNIPLARTGTIVVRPTLQF